MSVSTMVMKEWTEVFNHLFQRYKDMTADSELQEFCDLAISKIDVHPLTKLNRWLGYIQGKVIAEGVTSVQYERDYTRPMLKPLEDQEYIRKDLVDEMISYCYDCGFDAGTLKG